MEPVSQAEIRQSLRNCSRSEVSAMTFPAEFATLDWASLDFLGWRDRKFPQRGYLVRQNEKGLTTLMLRTAETKMSARKKAMCSICHAVDSADAISLFTTRQHGAAGRNGSTVGTYICGTLDCSAQLVGPRRKASRTMASWNMSIEEQAREMYNRLDAFFELVCGGSAVKVP